MPNGTKLAAMLLAHSYKRHSPKRYRSVTAVSSALLLTGRFHGVAFLRRSSLALQSRRRRAPSAALGRQAPQGDRDPQREAVPAGRGRVVREFGDAP